MTVADCRPAPARVSWPWRIVQRFAALPEGFHTRVVPDAPGAAPRLVHGNAAGARLLGLDPDRLADPDGARLLSGHALAAGYEPLSSVYAGHQFGQYVPQLGDGRAHLIAEVEGAGGRVWEVQLKGAGRTPFSRFGDGRAVLRSCLREYLCSEALAGLGIPTTRALAVVATGEKVPREAIEPGAVMTRLAPSHVRFGHFEFFHHTGQPDAVRMLADHVIDAHFPDAAAAGRERHAAWFGAVVARTADLIAAWQAAGFAHGVMNTDNMSILGLTIDYGPFGFLDDYDPGHVCNHSDHTGRYAFDRQPAIALWNLRALGHALTSLIDVDALKAALESYWPRFEESYAERMAAKLGLARRLAGDGALIEDLLSLMAGARADYTASFRDLADLVEGRDPMARARWAARFGAERLAGVSAWLERYEARLARAPDPARPARMRALNPRYVLRNWLAETAIRAAEDAGDTAPLDEIMTLVQAPYEAHPASERFAAPPPDALKTLSVSCSS